MVRGPKKHMKRLNAPKHWMLDKLGGIFVSRNGLMRGATACSRSTVASEAPPSARQPWMEGGSQLRAVLMRKDSL